MSRINGLSFWGPGNRSGSTPPPLDLPLAAAIHLALETGTLTPVTGSVTPTFTRATERVMPDVDGILRTVPSGAFTPGGFRVVHNLVQNNSEDITAESVAFDANSTVTATTIELTGTNNSYYYLDLGTAEAGRTYIARVKVQWISGDTDVGIRFTRAIAATDYAVVDLSDGAEKIVYLQITPAADGPMDIGVDNRTSFLPGVGTGPTKVTFTEYQLEDISGQVNQNPSEYVSKGVLSSPYHGTGADGIKYFTTFNGNTVSNNIVTEGTGAAITADNSKFGVSLGRNTERFEHTPTSMPTGSAIFIFEGSLDWTASGNKDIFSQFGGAGDQTFIMRVASTGVMQAVVHDGTNQRQTSNTTSSLPFVDGEYGRIAMFVDVPNDQVIFKYSLDGRGVAPADATWTTLETEALPGAITGLQVSSRPVLVAALYNGGGYFNETACRFYRAYVIDGLDVTAAPSETITPDTVTPQANAYIYTPIGLGYIPYPAFENLQIYSKQLNKYTKHAVTIDADQAIGPDGTLTADRVNIDTSTAVHQVFDERSITTSSNQLFQVHLKYDGAQYVGLRVYVDIDEWATVVVDLLGATVTQTSTGASKGVVNGSRVDRLPNGWVEVAINVSMESATGGASTAFTVQYHSSGTPSLSTTGSESVAGVAGEDWFDTNRTVVDDVDSSLLKVPVIPTEASTVTHNADDSDNTGAAFDATTGTLYATITTGDVVGDGVIAQLDDDSASDIVKLEIVSGALTGTITSAAGDDVSITGSALSANTEYAVAIAWAADDAQLYLDGVSDGTDATLDPPSVTLTNLRSGVDESAGSQPGLLIKTVKVYTQRLTTAQVGGL